MSIELLKECAERLDSLYGVENELSNRVKKYTTKKEEDITHILAKATIDSGKANKVLIERIDVHHKK